MATAHVNGISIGYDDSGGGNHANAKASERAALLLIHGHPFDRSMWSPQMTAAATAGWRVIVPDLRGYGESTVVPGKTTLDVFADDLAALLDTLGIARVVIGGLSMGGQIAMEFARLHGARLDGLILAATFPRVDTDDVKQLRLTTADRLERECLEGRDGMTAYAAELLPKMLAAVSITGLPHVADHVRTMMRHAPPRGAAAAMRGRSERPAYEPILASLTMPALIVAGDDDVFTTADDVEQMRQLLPHSRLVRMPGVGHMPNLERPEAFNAALIAFLAAIRRGV